MKMKWTIFALVLMAAAAFAQAPAAKAKKTATPAKSTSSSSRKASKTRKAVLANPMAPKTAKPKAVRKAHVAAPKKPEQPPTDVTAAVAAPGRKRDPFVSPVEARLEGLGQGACSTGKRCLAVQEIVLRGVVKSQAGMIAVVENAAQRTYFLHENDPIYNGFVERITPDSVIFKEHYIDNLGHDSQREVVKTVNAPVV